MYGRRMRENILGENHLKEGPLRRWEIFKFGGLREGNFISAVLKEIKLYILFLFFDVRTRLNQAGGCGIETF